MATAALLILLGASLIFQSSGCSICGCQALTAGSSGACVVKAAVTEIQRSGIFPSDNDFLRRIAYVESRDGTDSDTYRAGYHGGIWQVNEMAFQDTQDINSHPCLATKHNLIKKHFGIDWTTVKWMDLRKPFYSALAARLYLSNIPDLIPPSADIQGQANYWKEHYDTPAGNGTVVKFINDVNELGRW